MGNLKQIGLPLALQIEKASVEDLLPISELWGRDLQAPWTKTSIEETFKVPETYTLVARNFKKALPFLGFVMGSFLGDVGEIYAIAVVEEFKRKGIGSDLLSNFIKEAILRNVQNLFLEVAEINKRALSFYEKFGFEEISRRKNYYSSIRTEKEPILIDAVVLRKIL